MFVCFGVHVCIYIFFYQSVSSAVVHVVISHRGAWRPVAHCVLCSSDGHGLSCSTTHFLFSICPHGWEAFFSLQLYEIIEMEKVLFIFCREKDSIKALNFFSGTRPLMWFPFVSDVFWLMLSNQSPFVSWWSVCLSVPFMCV